VLLAPGVADELWNALGRNIAPGRSTRVGDEELHVPLERFLSSRRWLAQALTTYGCAADIDPTLLDVLSRGDAERREVARILSGDAESLAEAQVEELLAYSRFIRALMSFQLRDLAHVLSLSHGANFSVPGAGKTTVAYACYEAERVRGPRAAPARSRPAVRLRRMGRRGWTLHGSRTDRYAPKWPRSASLRGVTGQLSALAPSLRDAGCVDR
jgi:hypothetical protein